MKFNKKQPFINYCWHFGFDWSLRRNGLSNRRSPLNFGVNRRLDRLFRRRLQLKPKRQQ